jgi:beta-N-acetylhexosaminidase
MTYQKHSKIPQVAIEKLESVGFKVDLCLNYYDLEVENDVSPMNFVKMLNHGKRFEFKENHDVVFLVINIKGYAQENEVCVRSVECQWVTQMIVQYRERWKQE